jgi:hypothetical protein
MKRGVFFLFFKEKEIVHFAERRVCITSIVFLMGEGTVLMLTNFNLNFNLNSIFI